MTTKTREDHRLHETDGRWHDDCPYCIERRHYGGPPLAGQCGDDPREWDADGKLKRHRPECFVVQHRWHDAMVA